MKIRFKKKKKKHEYRYFYQHLLPVSYINIHILQQEVHGIHSRPLRELDRERSLMIIPEAKFLPHGQMTFLVNAKWFCLREIGRFEVKRVKS